MENGLTRVETGVSVREEFGAVERQRSAEMAQAAVAARAQAEIQARYVMALQRPRSVEAFRVALLKECARPGFAEEAEYERPVGREKNEQTGQWEQKIARGPSIRLIETAIRYFGNVAAEAPVVYESDEVRMVRAAMVDLETNTLWSQDIIVPKRVEKRGTKNKKGEDEPPKGRQVVGSRINSNGEMTYLVAATDDEIAVKQSALISKAQRKNGERLLPSDIIHEAIQRSRETIAKGIADNPDAAIRRVIDGFAGLNIRPDDLAEYIGKKLEFIQPAEIAELRRLWKAISDGEITWEAALATKDPGGSKEAQAEVARRKLEDLRTKSTAPKADPPAAATTAAPQQQQQQSEPTSEQPEPLNWRAEISAFMATIGPKSANILGEFGFESLDQVTEDRAVEIINAMKQALPKRSLNLGGKK